MPRASSFLLLVLVLALPLAGAAPASEAEPGCEPGQARAAGLACQGEHWDGQDPVREGTDACTGALRPEPGHLSAGACAPSDPNARPGDDVTSPLSARASQGEEAVYASAGVAFLGRAAVYADGGTAAVYVRDDTPGNLVMTWLQPPRLTPPQVADGDCDQATYEAGACWRDNTAVTVEHALLP